MSSNGNIVQTNIYALRLLLGKQYPFLNSYGDSIEICEVHEFLTKVYSLMQPLAITVEAHDEIPQVQSWAIKLLPFAHTTGFVPAAQMASMKSILDQIFTRLQVDNGAHENMYRAYEGAYRTGKEPTANPAVDGATYFATDKGRKAEKASLAAREQTAGYAMQSEALPILGSRHGGKKGGKKGGRFFQANQRRPKVVGSSARVTGV